MRNISLFVEDTVHEDFLIYASPAACLPAAGSPAA